MSPLKINLLLNAYSRAVPNGQLTQGQAYAPAMLEAIDDFKRLGLFHESVTASTLRYAQIPPGEVLTAKGRGLVDRFQEVEA